MIKKQRAAAVIQDKRKDLSRENARLRGDLLTISRRIGHDMRTPLGGILSSGELLQELLKDKDPKLARLATAILNSTEEMLRLIRRTNLITTASNKPGYLQPVRMGEPVSAALKRLGDEIRKRNATITRSESWPVVNGDIEWLEEIWWNFLANALRDSGENPRIELGWQEKDGKLRFWISDSGPGVSADRLNQLFQPFDQLHELNACRGLGLSIVRRLVELQFGDYGYKANKKGGVLLFYAASHYARVANACRVGVRAVLIDELDLAENRLYQMLLP